jgi:hypothetical protein
VGTVGLCYTAATLHLNFFEQGPQEIGGRKSSSVSVQDVQ